MTRFKELCLDSSEDTAALARFWAAATGCVARGEDVFPPEGGLEGMGIAICPVPEQKSVKNRVHFDVHAESVESLLALGATIAPGYPDDLKWTVLLDPEGNELCAFVREEVPAYKGYELVVDSADAPAIARWWADVFGVEAKNDGQTWWWLEDVPGMPFESWLFDDAIPEPKTVKNRLHWDVYGDVDELLAKGARRLWETRGWVVLADPEGNEFCCFPEG